LEDTEAALMGMQLSQSEIAQRFASVSRMVEEISQQRSEERVGEVVEVLFDAHSDEGRSQYQAPDIDGITRVDRPMPAGTLIQARVVEALGVDVRAEIL
jgi:tRNA A37 methylthiotransferase MiaB